MPHELGRVRLVGAGPGAADLLTVRALRAIEGAQALLYDALISDEVKNNPGVFPTAEVMPKLVPDLPETPEFTRALTRTWTKFRTGK